MDNQTTEENVVKRVAIISDGEGVVVRGIEKILADYEIEATFVGTDSKAISSKGEETDYFITSLSGSMARYEKALTVAYNITKEHGDKELIVIGEKSDFDQMGERLPKIRDYRRLERPVDLESMADYINTHVFEPEAEESATDPAEQPEEIIDDVKTILIVDDDPTYAKMVRGWIKDIYKTAVVTSGMQAITYVLNNKVDLIMLDYEMPVVSGPQVFQMLSENEDTKDIPVVFLTGVKSLDKIKKVMALKPAGYLLKSSPSEQIMDWLMNFFAN